LVAVVAVTESSVAVVVGEPVDEFARLSALCSGLSAENEQLWREATRLAGENGRLRERVEKLEHQQMLEWLGLENGSEFDSNAVPSDTIDYELALTAASR
jgi:hypothetical protein